MSRIRSEVQLLQFMCIEQWVEAQAACTATEAHPHTYANVTTSLASAPNQTGGRGDDDGDEDLEVPLLMPDSDCSSDDESLGPFDR